MRSCDRQKTPFIEIFILLEFLHNFYDISYDFALHFVYRGNDEIFFCLYCVVGITYLIKMRFAFAFAFIL